MNLTFHNAQFGHINRQGPATMAFSTRSLSGHLRQGSTTSNPNAQSTGQSAALLSRINEKKAELESLKELRELSAAVANEMEALEQKLSTLSDGTEGKSCPTIIMGL